MVSMNQVDAVTAKLKRFQLLAYPEDIDCLGFVEVLQPLSPLIVQQ
jgi:hypothetical protein